VDAVEPVGAGCATAVRWAGALGGSEDPYAGALWTGDVGGALGIEGDVLGSRGKLAVGGVAVAVSVLGADGSCSVCATLADDIAKIAVKQAKCGAAG
jgi:hypothetical protein